MSKKNIKPKVPKLPKEEAEQVRVRRDLGHDFALRTDQHGRQRLRSGTAEAKRVYDVSNDGHTSTGGIARVRNVDPLKGILSLTPRQREAGRRYREDFELSATEGMKAGSYQERVDGGRQSSGVAPRVLQNHSALNAARTALSYDEIVLVLDAVCGLGMSIKELSGKANTSRDIPAQLLRMGLDRLASHYGTGLAQRS